MLPIEDLKHVFTQTETLWNQLQGKTIFLSGGTGFVGTWLLESFLYANQALSLQAKMVVLSRDPDVFFKKHPHLKDEKSLAFIKGDVRSFAEPEGAFDYAFHAAVDPAASLGGSQALDAFDVSVAGTKRVLELCKTKKVKKVLFVSSGAVYGKQPADITHVEETYAGAPDLSKSSSMYGEGKRVGELMSRQYGQTYGFDVSIARLFAFVGPGLPLDGHYAVGNFIRNILSGENICIKGDGSAKRSYMYASDMAIWLWHILFRGESFAAYNVGSDKELSILQLAKKIISIENPKLEVVVQGASTGNLSGDLYVPSVKKAASDLGLRLSVPDDAALKKTIEFYKKTAEAQ
ncbi:NAD-dependent epimerase/dehydratase family protein [Bdellovibrio sp. HCB337]|uniref:NAD-dependent epimerase/dehydratase family protein n=1 Tax=Bdellovibrio sp. HCB337 TaxID=3394358 RepID=UPI0039A6C4F6